MFILPVLFINVKVKLTPVLFSKLCCFSRVLHFLSVFTPPLLYPSLTKDEQTANLSLW